MIYLDHAAATPLRPEVLQAMLPYLEQTFANPSSIYSLGRQANIDLQNFRTIFADILNIQPEEFIFTSGGTESCNLAVRGIAKARALNGSKKHIITSQIEHSSVLNTCQMLESEGFTVDYLAVDKDGIISLEELTSKITKDTALVSVIYANNEIGAVQPIQEIAAICKSYNVSFHTDACQAPGYLEIQPSKLQVQAISFNAAKIYGPKGVGGLYLELGTPFLPQISGGTQEFGFRAGTENLAGIAGFATAFEFICQEKAQELPRISKLQQLLLTELLQIDGVTINGSLQSRIANNLNISIEGVEGESVLVRLDQKGILVSTGSACSSQSIEPSHVLLALGLNKNQAHSSLRISLGKSNNEAQILVFIQTLKEIISDLRSLANSSW